MQSISPLLFAPRCWPSRGFAQSRHAEVRPRARGARGRRLGAAGAAEARSRPEPAGPAEPSRRRVAQRGDLAQGRAAVCEGVRLLLSDGLAAARVRHWLHLGHPALCAGGVRPQLAPGGGVRQRDELGRARRRALLGLHRRQVRAQAGALHVLVHVRARIDPDGGRDELRHARVQPVHPGLRRGRGPADLAYVHLRGGAQAVARGQG